MIIPWVNATLRFHIDHPAARHRRRPWSTDASLIRVAWLMYLMSLGMVKRGFTMVSPRCSIWLWVKTLVPGWYTNIAGKWMVIAP